MIGMPNSAEITVCSVGFQPTMKLSGRNNRPCLVLHRRPIVQPNVGAREEREEQIVRQIDVEARPDAQLPQHAAVVIAFKINSVTHLWREVAARTDLREHGADGQKW